MVKKLNFRKVVITILLAIPLAILFYFTTAGRIDLTLPRGVVLPFGWKDIHSSLPDSAAKYYESQNNYCNDGEIPESSNSDWPLLSTRYESCRTYDNRLASDMNIIFVSSLYMATALLFIGLVTFTRQKLVKNE